jgi:hypothetical protein
MTGVERNAVLMAMWDGVPTMSYKRHAFLPVGWIRKNFPKVADTCDMIETRIGTELG